MSDEDDPYASADEEEQGPEPTKDETKMDMTVELSSDGKIKLKVGNPAVPVAAKSQYYSYYVKSHDGSQEASRGGIEDFPSSDLGPGQYETIDIDAAHFTLWDAFGSGSGFKLTVSHVNVGKALLVYDIVDGKCHPTGDSHYEPWG